MNISKLSLVDGRGEQSGIIAYRFVHHLLEHCNQIRSFLHLIQHTNAMAFELHHPRLLHHLKREIELRTALRLIHSS